MMYDVDPTKLTIKNGPQTHRGRRTCRRIGAWIFTLMLLAGAVGSHAYAQSKPGTRDLTETSLEELMNIEVVSVSKKEERLFQTAAAIYVITQEDIRRSGLTSLPELLRMAPGLSVARIDSNKWAISSRGFNGRFADKMLVMIDGRSVYSPLFSGVFWEVQDLVLDDVERIEIIRGPGATLWGANAVNGVINIITKHTNATEGGLLTAGAGSEELGSGTFRYGDRVNANAGYRVYAKFFLRDSSVDFSGRPVPDQWNAARGGFRLDWQATPKESLTLQGDMYSGGASQRVALFQPVAPYFQSVQDRFDFSGGNVGLRWKRISSDRSDSSMQAYYDQTKRDEAYFGEGRDTLNIDFQHHQVLNARNDLMVGVGYRATWDRLSDRLSTRFSPSHRTVNLFNGFAQDEIVLAPRRVRLTLGSKFEHNSYTGFEIQPNVRLLWTPSDRQTVWGSISRSVRTPARIEVDLEAPYQVIPGGGPVPTVVTVFGNKAYQAETQRSYEIGYRRELAGNLSMDVATFYSEYGRLRGATLGAPYFAPQPAPARAVVPLTLGNVMSGESYGAEIVSNWNVTTRWKLAGGYTFVRVQLHGDPALKPVLAPDVELEEGNSPRHQAQVRSYLRLPRNLEFDLALYRVGKVERESIPGYTRVDARLGWRATESFEFSLGLQNLLDPRHPEFGLIQQGETPTQARRNIYGKMTWRF